MTLTSQGRCDFRVLWRAYLACGCGVLVTVARGWSSASTHPGGADRQTTQRAL